MTTVTASELQKNFGKYQVQAQRQPIKVTSHGRDSVALISAEDYERYRAMDTRRAYHVSDVPEDIAQALEDSLEEMKDIEATDYPVLNF